MQLGALHLHAGADLLLCGCIALYCPAQAHFLGSIHEEYVVNTLVEAALEEDGALQADRRALTVALCPFGEVAEDGGMDDGVHFACILFAPEEEVGKSLLHKFLAAEHFGPYESDELTANLRVGGSEAFRFRIAVVDGNVEPLSEDGRDEAFPAPYASGDSYCALWPVHEEGVR